jgi:hypothetical protein
MRGGQKALEHERTHERTAEDGTYRIQSLHYQLIEAEKKAGIPHIRGRGLHGFRRQAAGDVFDVLKDVKLAMEFINDTGAMAKKYIVRRSDRLQATATAMNAAAGFRNRLPYQTQAFAAPLVDASCGISTSAPGPRQAS